MASFYKAYKKGTSEIVYFETNEQQADIMMKPLAKP